MKNTRTELSQRVQYALLAGMAGAFLIPQVGFAAPSGADYDKTTITINQTSDLAQTDITSTKLNNVINWRDYSVNQGEIVQYDGGNKTNNYLNIVTGANTSNINGKIKGGNNVYIVNPNGVIFGKSAEVNVGNLYVSTQAVSRVNKDADMENNVSPLDTSAGLSDVVNMGEITAKTVEVHGKNIRFLNAANVHTTASPVVLHTDTANGGYAHIGYRGTVPTNYKVNPTTTNPAGVSPEYYQLVKDKTELDAINTTNLAGNYMLENDIDLGGAAHTPIGGNAHGAFTGKFDGNFFRIENIKVSGVDNAGLFGVLNGASIYNVGVVGGSVTSNTTSGSETAGGIAGRGSNAALYNVYAKGTAIAGNSYEHAGILGHADNTTIDGAYSTSTVGVDGAGILGTADSGTHILNTYNGAVYTADNKAAAYLLASSNPGTATVKHSYTNSETIAPSDTNIQTDFTDVYVKSQTKPGKMKRINGGTPTDDLDPHASATYAAWGNDINNDGAPGAKWRIYEGRTLPLLTAFMNGRVDSVGSVGANYSYRKFNQADGTEVKDPANTATSNNHADITGLTYDSKIVKIVDVAGNAGNTSNVTYDKTLTDDQKNTLKMYTDTVLDTTKNVRNAGTKAILWSDQDGPNLRNVNVTIGKRKIDVTGANIVATRVYDGTNDVTEAFKKALKLSANGFTEEDLNDSDPLAKVVVRPSATFRATMENKDAGDNKKVSLSGKLDIRSDVKDPNNNNDYLPSTSAENYEINNLDFGSHTDIKGTANITKAPLILDIKKEKAKDKIYDGTDKVIENDPEMNVDPNVKLNPSLTMKIGDETVTADIKGSDQVGMEDIAAPTYVKSDGKAEIHAGDDHIIRYKNVKLKGNDAKNYQLYYKLKGKDPQKVTGDHLDLKGTITRRQITTNDFKVYEQGTNNPVEATKTYDGNDIYDPTKLNPPKSVYLSTDQNGETGIVGRDKGHITFAMKDGAKGKFNTKNVKGSSTISYTVIGKADSLTDTYGGHLLSDYYVDVGGEQKNLEEEFAASGKGKITPKVLTATIPTTPIEKTYDGTKDHTKKGKDIVTIEGFVDDDTRENTSTVTYTNENVVSDAIGSQEKEQNVTYTASFERATGDESDNYTLDPTGKNVVSSVTPTGNYKGIIKRRALTLEMGRGVQKVYDGTAANKESGITAIRNVAERDKATVTADTLKNKHRDMLTAGTAKSSYGRGTDSYFVENANASNGNTHNVRYENMDTVFRTAFDALKNNYTMDATVYGKGEITRRRINPDGFQVLRKQSDGTYRAENISKTYDGTSTYTLPDGAYLRTPTVIPTPSDKTGIIEQDKDKIRFRLASNTHGTFQKTDGTETTHVSEAKKVAYQVVAYGVEGTAETDAPLRNYTFGTVAEETGGTLKNLENLKEGKTPAAVTADGSITPAKIQATTHAVEKVYDGTAEHRDKNREIVTGDAVVTFTGWTSDSDKRTNASTATYADKNVARNAGGGVIEKNVTYKAQLTGQYADDYEITGITAGAGTALASGTATTLTVANAGTITPRKLNIKMGDVSKTYDGKSTNTSSTVTEITDVPQTSVIGTILGGDSITTGALKTAWENKRASGTASSSYGNGTGSAFQHNANASNGTPHDVRYTKMDEAFKDAFGTTAAGNYTVDKTVYGKGTINRKAIDPNNFDVVDAHGNASHATKVYDGTSSYTVPSGWKLKPSTGPATGVIGDDGEKIEFGIDPDKGAHFTKADNTTETANAYEAKRVAYNVKATTDQGYEYLLKNYTLNGKNLETGEGTATGEGEITRRVLSLGLVQDEKIDKVYDGSYKLVDGEKNWNKLKDGDAKGNVVYTGRNKLVNDGTSLTITSEYRNDANTEHDKNVRGTSASPQVKDILYNISITGGDANNYSFDGGTSSAAGGLKLSASGTIMPKDISNAFKPMTKVYDGGTTVDRSKVELASGTFIGNDSARVKNTYQAEFESPNVNGNSEGKNWVNYTHLELDGTNANNYTIASATTGKGSITPYILDSNSVKFKTREASKVYDGTTDVKWTNGSSELNDVKNYITGATVDLTPVGGGATTTKSVLEALNLTEKPQYDKKDVDGGRKTDRVTYTLSYDRTKNPNFSLGTGVTSFTTKGDGIITKKDVTATVKSSLSKVYDATRDVANASDNITLKGLVAGDGTTYTTTARYADKNVGTNKTVTYDVKLDAASVGNYTLKFNNAKVSTLNPVRNEENEITKRKVNVTFGDVSKPYDTTTKNNKPIVGTVSAEDAAVLNTDHAGLVADDTPNNIKNKLQNLAGLDSDYGTVKTDGRFDADPNVGIKSVQYAGLRDKMNTTLGGDAGNYEFDVNGYGKGSIARRTIDASKFKFKTNAFAEKEYDGTWDVKWQGDKDKIKNYFASSKVEIDGEERDINLKDIDVSTEHSKYRTKDVGAYQMTADGKKYNAKVDYRISFSSDNFDITGLTAGGYIPYEDKGLITPKDVNVTVNSSLTKTYDATEKVTAGTVKNAAGETVSDLNKNITFDGLVAGDGTTYTTTARYADKNAGTNKTVTYDVKLDAASAGNYTLKFNNAKVSASNPVQNEENEITKRRVNVTFGDVSKPYDTTTKNNKPIVGTVSAEDAAVLNTDHAGIVADDTPNNIKNKLQNLVGLDSNYGTGDTDETFKKNPNVGTKSVQYAGLRDKMNMNLGGAAANYEFDVNGYGKGSIARRTIDASKFKFKTNAFAEKEYDGTRDVKWQGDKDKIKNYFASSKVEIDGVERDINLKDIDVSTEYSKYRTKDVGAYQMTADGKKYNAKVDYRISFSSDNFDITGLAAGGYIPYEDKGLITPKDITPYFTKDHIIKEYDGSSRLSDPNKEAIEKTKQLSILVQGDDVTLDVVGRYMDSTRTQEEKNASADTKEDAQARTNTTAGLSVAYDLKLGGAQKNNYTIGAQGDTGTVYGTGDIYKKTLTVNVGRKVKEYDGTAAVNNLTKNDVTFKGMVDNESLQMDDDSIKKVKGQYLDSAGKPDENVRRDANRNVLDKAVEYTGLNDALNDLATRNNTAKNYRVEDGSRRYTADDGKGRIDPLKFHDPSNDVKMTFAATGPSKTYDRETTVKYKGLGTGKALKNYLIDATVMVGGEARSIKDELEIDPTRTHYDNKNAGTGKTVTYGFKYQGNNFEIADFTKESDVKGEIRRKDVKVLPVDQLWKTYDSERDVYVEGDDSIFTRRGGKQGPRVTTGDSVLKIESSGIISGDVVQNDSWAEFEDENAGTGKKVKYHTSFSGTDAANYRFVDVSGGEITKPLETDNNTIEKRKLNIGFDGLPNVTKAYDTDTKNDKITARITDDPNGSARKVLQRDNVHVFGDRLTQLNHTNIQSDYGEGKTDQTFRSDPNAGRKDVQYRGVGKALRNILGDYADNYETVPDNAYSDGAITKADVSRNEFDPNFTHAHKEYDGTSDVQNLDKRYDKERSFWNAHELDKSNIESLTGSYRGTSSKRGKDVGTNKIVDYTLKLSNRNFNFVGWDGVIQKEGTGDITPRELTAEHLPKQTKVYDGTKNIASVGDDLVTVRHKSGASAFIDGDKVRNSSTATYDDANVAWKNDVWKQGSGQESDKDVNYDLKLSGEDAANYKIVDGSGTEIHTLKGKNNGKIMAKDIHLKADSQTRWINEGLPDSYSGTPMGSNLGRKDVSELVPGEVLPGQIEYSSPNARLRWGDYAINGTYRAPNAGARYQLPDGTWTTQSFAGGDGDAVSRNYRFVQDPANATAFHMGPYVPDNQYYKALTQASKMLPNEYAYEHATLDYRSHFGRDVEAEIATAPPSINVIYDDTDVTRAGIHVTDDTVYTIVNEVFGA